MKNLFRQKNVLYLLFPFALILALIAAGSLVDFSQYPSAAADGAAWDKNWEMMAKVVGIEAPGGGLTLLTNNSVLAGEDTYYAPGRWASPPPTPTPTAMKWTFIPPSSMCCCTAAPIRPPPKAPAPVFWPGSSRPTPSTASAPRSTTPALYRSGLHRRLGRQPLWAGQLGFCRAGQLRPGGRTAGPGQL